MSHSNFADQDLSEGMFPTFLESLRRIRTRNPLDRIRNNSRIVEIWVSLLPVELVKSHVLRALSHLCSRKSPFKGLLLIGECVEVVKVYESLRELLQSWIRKQRGKQKAPKMLVMGCQAIFKVSSPAFRSPFLPICLV